MATAAAATVTAARRCVLGPTFRARGQPTQSCFGVLQGECVCYGEYSGARCDSCAPGRFNYVSACCLCLFARFSRMRLTSPRLMLFRFVRSLRAIRAIAMGRARATAAAMALVNPHSLPTPRCLLVASFVLVVWSSVVSCLTVLPSPLSGNCQCDGGWAGSNCGGCAGAAICLDLLSGFAR